MFPPFARFVLIAAQAAFSFSKNKIKTNNECCNMNDECNDNALVLRLDALVYMQLQK